MSIRIKSGLSIDILEVDSNNETEVTLPFQDSSGNSELETSGYFSLVSEIDDGSVLGTRTLKQTDSSQDYRIRCGKDKVLWHDKFNYATLNTSNLSFGTFSETISIGSGYLSLNSTEDAGATRYSIARTYRSFTNYDTYPIYGDMVVGFTRAFDNNNIIEFGFGVVSADTTPTDGIFFRVSGGTLCGVINDNSSETVISNLFTPSANEFNHYLIVFDTEEAEFWVDDVLRGTIGVPTNQGSVCSSNSLPLFFRTYNKVGVVTASQLLVSQATVSLGDMISNKDWSSTMVGSQLSSINYPSGYLTGQTTNMVNSTAPSTATTLSNTVTTFTSLGGDFSFSATTSGETDYILYAFQCPTGSTTSSSKNLIITGIQINTSVGPVATGANVTTIQWGMGFGSTSVSLATTDSVTTFARGPRRIVLGCQTFAASSVANTAANNPIKLKFKTPYIVEPSTFLHVFFKTPIAPTPASGQSFRGNILINGYFE